MSVVWKPLGLSVQRERALLSDGVRALEDPVLPGAQPPEDLAVAAFGPGETMETRVFARLSAWQNWIFVRPNAVGDAGALKVFGTGSKARFDWDRI